MLVVMTAFVVLALSFAKAFYETYGGVTGILGRSWTEIELSKIFGSLLVLALFLGGIFYAAKRYFSVDIEQDEDVELDEEQ